MFMSDDLPKKPGKLKDKTPFDQWFDINNKEHLRAYGHCIEHNEWPKHFLPADVEFLEWSSLAKVDKNIVKAWITAKLATGKTQR